MNVINNIIHRPDDSTLYENALSFGHIMIENLTKASEKTLLVSGITGEELTATKLLNKSIEIAKALEASGVKQGDVVSIMSENRFEFAYVMFGSIFLNCALAPINNSYSEREIKHALNLSKPKIIFASAAVSQQVINVAKSLSFIEKVVLLDDETRKEEKIVQLKDFLNSRVLQNVKFEPKACELSKTACLIMCSSGTTGLPKGVQISQKNIIVTARHANSAILNSESIGDGEVIVLGLLPLFHVFGAAVLISAMLAASAKIVLLPKFEEKTFLSCIERYRCNILFAVPPLMVFLAKNEIVDKFDIKSLQLIFCGAAPLSKELELSVLDRLKIPNLVVKQGYGMSELTVGVCGQKEIVKHGSVGEINPGVYAKVVDENGKALGPYESGELCFKGSFLMMGYVGDEQATKAMIDADGYLHTGDVGYYDEDLQFFIVDRIKELIKWKGFQVPPAGLLNKSLKNFENNS